MLFRVRYGQHVEDILLPLPRFVRPPTKSGHIHA
jgi:hypothetical protein